MNSAAEIWERVLSILKQNLTETTISTWFSDIEAVSLDENQFILSVPTEFKQGILNDRYREEIQKALFELFSAEIDVVILKEQEKAQYQNPQEVSRFLPGTEEYTFERFVVGNSNKLAHAAARAVADHPAQNYNPLFIHGESGLGKTHLLYAIAHTIHADHPDYQHRLHPGATPSPTSSSGAIRAGQQPGVPGQVPLRRRLPHGRRAVHRRAKDSTHGGDVPHLQHPLRGRRKQIVFTADRPPKEMLRLEDRLKTRFEWGLLADIQPPRLRDPHGHHQEQGHPHGGGAPRGGPLRTSPRTSPPTSGRSRAR